MVRVSNADHKLCARKSSSWETMKSLGVAPLQENLAGDGLLARRLSLFTGQRGLPGTKNGPSWEPAPRSPSHPHREGPEQTRRIGRPEARLGSTIPHAKNQGIFAPAFGVATLPRLVAASRM